MVMREGSGTERSRLFDPHKGLQSQKEQLTRPPQGAAVPPKRSKILDPHKGLQSQKEQITRPPQGAAVPKGANYSTPTRGCSPILDPGS